jgi:predicted Zn finger-like uncharacterized protein
MPFAVQCSLCGVRLRIPEEKAGKLVRCPKCSQVFRAPAGEERYADFEDVEEPPAASSSEATQSAHADTQDSETPTTYLQRMRRADSGPDWKVIGGVLFTVFAVGVGAYLFFMSARTAVTAFAELADIFENAASALENARQPRQRNRAAQQLDEQARRLNRWVSTYRDKKEPQAVIDAASRRYGSRIANAARRVGGAMQQLEQDQAAMQDPQLRNAVGNWQRAFANFAVAVLADLVAEAVADSGVAARQNPPGKLNPRELNPPPKPNPQPRKLNPPPKPKPPIRPH